MILKKKKILSIFGTSLRYPPYSANIFRAGNWIRSRAQEVDNLFSSSTENSSPKGSSYADDLQMDERKLYSWEARFNGHGSR